MQGHQRKGQRRCIKDGGTNDHGAKVLLDLKHDVSLRAGRFLRILPLAGMALLVLFTAGPSSLAEDGWDMMRDPTINRGRPLGQASGTRPQAPQGEVRRRRVEQHPRTIAAPPDVIVNDQPTLPKVDPAHFIVVIGDTMAELLAGGLEDTFADRPDVAILRKSRSDSGLVRSDFHDWGRAARELLAGDHKISVAVMLIGANDRQAIREGELSHEPLSERWREIYKERIDAVASAFAERKVPLIWIGAPPMQSPRLTTDIIMFNDMFRQRTERAGGTYVDLWDAFIDPANKYTAFGPDLTGMIARLRAADGVHFTKAGARKAAHFADVAIRRFLVKGEPRNILALPPASTTPLPSPDEPARPPIQNIEDMIIGMAGFANAPQNAALPQIPLIPVKPVAGPILQLTGFALAKDQALLNDVAAARGSGFQAGEIERVFADGVAPPPRNGRADDFRWPRR